MNCIRRVLAEAKAIGCEEPPFRMLAIIVIGGLLLPFILCLGGR